MGFEYKVEILPTDLVIEAFTGNPDALCVYIALNSNYRYEDTVLGIVYNDKRFEGYFYNNPPMLSLSTNAFWLVEEKVAYTNHAFSSLYFFRLLNKHLRKKKCQKENQM